MQSDKCVTVTDALMRAMEKADEMQAVVVFYYAKDIEQSGVVVSQTMNPPDILWLLEQIKAWLLGLAKR
jgi:hypothetical protein